MFMVDDSISIHGRKKENKTKKKTKTTHSCEDFVDLAIQYLSSWLLVLTIKNLRDDFFLILILTYILSHILKIENLLFIYNFTSK